MRVAIAGAGRGIGAACARALRGHDVVICARTAAEVHAVAAETGARAVVADLSTDKGAESFAEAAGAVELALICAGSAHAALALEDAGEEKIKKNFFSNSVAPVLAAGALIRRGAKHVLFLSSLATRRPPMPGAGPYTAAKAALESMVRTLAEECWPNTRANALCLGPVRTQLHVEAGTPREWIEQFPSPDEIAPLVLKAAGVEGSGRIVDAEALQRDPAAALAGDGRLAQVEPFEEAPFEAEPGRRPSPRVRAAVRASADKLHLYPRGAEELRKRIAALHEVPPACVALSGAGATELIERCLRAFCERNDEVVSPFPTFEILSALCSREGVRHRPVPARRTPDGLFEPRHSAEALLHAIGPRTRLVYVASPDNPTGAVLPDGERDKLAGVPLVVDEAWTAEPPAAVKTRAIHLRSLSKLHGLAALRIAWAVGPEEQVELLRRLELPFPLGAPQLAAAHAALDQPDRAKKAALLIARDRARTAQAFRALGCAVSESPAPILLVRHEKAGSLLFALRAAGLPVQEAHWDAKTVVLALGRRSQNRRAVSAAGRALGT